MAQTTPITAKDDPIEDALDKTVRPLLRQHGGGVTVQSFTDGVLLMRMTGGCANCPSAVTEIEEIAEAEIKRSAPTVRCVRVVTGVSDELLASARSLLNQRHKERK